MSCYLWAILQICTCGKWVVLWVELCCPRRLIEVLTFGTSECDFFGNRVTANINSYGHPGVHWVLNPTWLVSLYKTEKTQKYIEGRHIEGSSMWWWRQRLKGYSSKQWNAKNCQQTIRSWERLQGFSSIDIRESLVQPISSFWTSNLRTVRTQIAILLRHSVCGTFLCSPRKLTQVVVQMILVHWNANKFCPVGHICYLPVNIDQFCIYL